MFSVVLSPGAVAGYGMTRLVLVAETRRAALQKQHRAGGRGCPGPGKCDGAFPILCVPGLEDLKGCAKCFHYRYTVLELSKRLWEQQLRQILHAALWGIWGFCLFFVVIFPLKLKQILKTFHIRCNNFLNIHVPYSWASHLKMWVVF